MINSMNDLENILDSLIFEDPITVNIFDDDTHALELIESALYLMEDYMNENPTAISEPDFEEEFLEDIKEIFYIQFEEEILENDWIEDDLNELLEEAFKIFVGSFYPERSTSFTVKTDDAENNESERIKQILDKIEHIKQKPQPTQRTDDWYKFRHNLITASNAYKAFESQCTINQLIYEKCQPLKSSESDKNTNTMVNVNTPFHWGQKYEPVSVMLYEYLYNTKVDDFGCIKHDKFDFLGASPDGINIDTDSTRFGRMLEIKNIVNREINGVPKKEYWIQMQLQMEVCDLDECDFLETKFVEYQTAYEFFKELEIELEQGQEEQEQEKTKKLPVLDKKGVILYFHNILEVKPFYIYKPLNIVKIDEILQWEEDMVGLYQSPEYNMTYIKSIYWKLEKLSCVLVLRNKSWFKNNIQTLENVWNIIEKERITGYEHRAPNKKQKTKPYTINDISSGGLCLIKLQN